MNSFDLNVIQGETFSLTLTVRDVDGNPLNLSDFQMSGFYRNNYSSTGFINLNASGVSLESGVISITLNGSQTSLLPLGIGVYDVKLTDNNAYSFKAIGGNAYVYPQVTF